MKVTLFLSQSNSKRKLNYLLLYSPYGGSYFHKNRRRIYVSVKFFGKQRIISARCFVILIWILSNILCLHHNSSLVWKSLLFSTFSLKIMSSQSFYDFASPILSNFSYLFYVFIYFFTSPRRTTTAGWDWVLRKTLLYCWVTTESWDWDTESMVKV